MSRKSQLRANVAEAETERDRCAEEANRLRTVEAFEIALIAARNLECARAALRAADPPVYPYDGSKP